MKTRVLFLIESLSGGGAEKVLSVILRNMDKERFECNVCPIVDIGVYREEVKASATRYSPIISYDGGAFSRFMNHLKYKLVYSLLPSSWVYRLFVPKESDVEIAFCEGYVTKLLSQSGSKAKKIAWVHTDLAVNPWPLQKSVFRNMEEECRTYRCFDKVVCVSKAIDTIMRRDFGLDNTTVIYNPVDAEIVSLLSREESPVKMDSSCFNIVAVGRLVPQKGFDELIRVVAEMVDDLPNLCLYIVGEGSERPQLEEMIATFGAEGHICLTGYMANPYALMSRADLYVCSSRAEGFSLTVAEAMALEIPVISMDCSGPAELLENGRFGELCKTHIDLSKALRKAVLDKEYLADLRNKSAEGKARFNTEDSLVQIKDVLKAIS